MYSKIALGKSRSALLSVVLPFNQSLLRKAVSHIGEINGQRALSFPSTRKQSHINSIDWCLQMSEIGALIFRTAKRRIPHMNKTDSSANSQLCL